MAAVLLTGLVLAYIVFTSSCAAADDSAVADADAVLSVDAASTIITMSSLSHLLRRQTDTGLMASFPGQLG